MVDRPWQGDASSLVDAFRRNERSPVEELQATYAAIDASDLNAFCFLDRERALAAAKAPESYQFMRLGYFCPDSKDSSPEHLVFNRSVSLKDSFKPGK